MTQTDTSRWLEGVRVLDLTRLLPGPFCTLLFADMGADVIKIEDPSGGDYARYYPPFAGDVGAFYAAINRNKRSMTLNLKAPEGVALLHELAGTADVVIESFRPGVMDRLGVGYEALRTVNPRLVYCAISGFGASGPLRERAGHDLNFVARAGLLEQNGHPGARPAVPGFQVADIAGGGLFAALGIVSALYRRERTGEGAQIDLSMTEGALAFHLTVHATQAAGERVARGENMLNGGVPSYDVYETADGRYLAVAALEPKFWSAFVEAIGAPHLLDDGLSTGARGEEVRRELAAILASRTRDAWMEVFDTIDVCVEAVHSPAEVVDDALFEARKMFFELQGVRQVRTPLTALERDHRPAPALGADTDALLATLGRGPEDIAALRAGGVI